MNRDKILSIFPTPTKHEEILVDLYLKGITTSDRAVEISRDEYIEKLVSQGQLLETDDGRIYLSEDGSIVARGALILYPELRKEKGRSLDG